MTTNIIVNILGVAQIVEVPLTEQPQSPYLPSTKIQEVNMTLQELIAKSISDFKALSPQEQDDIRYEQGRSFARGMCPSNRDYDKWCKEVDRLLPPRTKSKGANIT
jgi:hypothetical protein